MGQRLSTCLKPSVHHQQQQLSGEWSLPTDKAHQVAQGFPLQDCAAPRCCECSSELRAELQLLREQVQALKADCAGLATDAAVNAPIPRSPRLSATPELQFKRVQFVPLLMMTGPHSDKEDTHYVGLPHVRHDFSARVDFVREALEAAEALADKDPEVLKIFALPEFFFRGPIGAYSLQDVLGDAKHPDSFIYQLQRLLAGERWASWLGIFGSIIGYQIAPGKKYRLHNVYNIALCQQGGFTNAEERGKKCDFILKHWVSKIDFLDGGGPGEESAIAFDDEKYLENHQQHYLDGLRAYGRLQDDLLVRVGGVTIGLEICLDHRNQRLLKNEPTRRYEHDKPIEIQVVISAGMSLMDDSIDVKRPGGLAFINDGQGCNDGAVDTRTDGRLYHGTDSYDRLSPALHPVFDKCSKERLELLGKLFCMHEVSIPTVPKIAVYPVVKVTDYDDK